MNKLKQIFDDNYSALCNYANVFVGSYDQSEDIVQTVFIQLWSNNKIFDLEDPTPYLLRCVKYKCMDYLKLRKPVTSLVEMDLPIIDMQQDLSFEEDNVEAIFAFLTAQLPKKTRQVFLMSRKQGMTYQEIAEELGVSPKTVENQMGNALRRMRDLLHKYNYLPGLLILFPDFFQQN